MFPSGLSKTNLWSRNTTQVCPPDVFINLKVDAGLNFKLMVNYRVDGV